MKWGAISRSNLHWYDIPLIFVGTIAILPGLIAGTVALIYMIFTVNPFGTDPQDQIRIPTIVDFAAITVAMLIGNWLYFLLYYIAHKAKNRNDKNLYWYKSAVILSCCLLSLPNLLMILAAVGAMLSSAPDAGQAMEIGMVINMLILGPIFGTIGWLFGWFFGLGSEYE
ncbi:hypothetical protein [Rhodoblastus sp.]|uniref:hypothetical protein n=1 Tax=Rhodoblastus sp. TaxID=1962975 RepID=UPI002634F7D7|nr:hypothetical protein [Rhodoblastus sp.]